MKANVIILLFINLFLCLTCHKENKKQDWVEVEAFVPKIYTKTSPLANQYQGFDSPKAINRIAQIENDYFNDFYNDKVSQYYGTIWREQIDDNSADSIYEKYRSKVLEQGEQPDSLHCTLYAYEGLKAGLDSGTLVQLEKYHKEIWKDREIAGWSIGYILVKYMNWKAYLFLDPNSHEYKQCMKSFQKNKTYPVWRQPAIPLEDLYLIGEENNAIQTLLKEHEFSWGFSDQGYHTWITRFNVLKECNWVGAPANSSYEWGSNIPLFIATPFADYHDYQSHVLVFPPKQLL